MKMNYVFTVDIVQGDGENANRIGSGPANTFADTLDQAIETIRTATLAQMPIEWAKRADVVIVMNLLAITVPVLGFPANTPSDILLPGRVQ